MGWQYSSNKAVDVGLSTRTESSVVVGETIPPLERISRVMVSRAGRAGSTHSETGLPAEFVKQIRFAAGACAQASCLTAASVER